MPARPASAQRIVFLVHYYPPINSSGGKRVEALSKYFTRLGRQVTVITTRKSGRDGAFTESVPPNVELIELDSLGRIRPSSAGSAKREFDEGGRPSPMRRLKSMVMRWCGQLPDPRLPFVFGFVSPLLDARVKAALDTADVVVASTPPWPMLLSAILVRWRFRKLIVLDYRDHFSECHEMPGSPLAKWMERVLDRWLARRAARLIAVSQPMAQYYAQFNPAVAVVMNGYDHEIIDRVRATTAWSARPAGSPLIVRYLGLITPDRVPHNLLRALCELQRRNLVDAAKLRFEYYGECSVMQAALASGYADLLPMFAFFPAVSYWDALRLTVTADYLLFAETSYRKTLSAQGILTTKLFEYLASGRPVIADIAPDTLAGKMLLRAEGRHIVLDEPQAFEALLLEPAFWNPAGAHDPPFVRTLSRSSQASEYLAELDALCARQLPMAATH